MRIQFFRFLFSEADQLDLINDSDQFSHEEAIGFIFGKKWKFEHFGTEMAYVPVKEVSEYQFARFGKKSQIMKGLPPKNNLEETKEEHWPHCHLFINKSTDPEVGQTILFQYKSSITNNPESTLKSFEEKINQELGRKGLNIEINSIPIENHFWELVDEYKGQIEELTFNFSPPNLFNLNNELEDDLEDAETKYGISQAGFKLENEDGNLSLPHDDELLRQSSDYVERGGGSYKVKVTERTISSDDKIKEKIVELEIEEMETDPENLVRIIRGLQEED